LWIDFDSESNDSGFGDAKGQAGGWGGGWSGVVPAWPAQRQAQKKITKEKTCNRFWLGDGFKSAFKGGCECGDVRRIT